MRILGYARLSSGSDESTSILRQREIITEHCQTRGWELVDIVEDPSASASKLRLNRPGLTRVRQAIASGEADAVLVWRLDRIARSVVDFGTLLDEGVPIVSATEPLDTTSAMGRAMAEILQVFAAMEARAISARISMSVDYLRRNDRYPGGIPPYGYRPAPHPDGVGRVLEIDATQAAVVQEVARRVLAGESTYAVSRDLNDRGIPTARGAKGWSTQALLGMLTGDAVLGRVTSRGEVLRDEHGLPRQVWPAILTVEESQRLRALLAPKRAIGVRRKAARLLSGLLYCSSCDAALVVQRRRTPRERDGKTFVEATGYRCRASSNGHPCAEPVSVRADMVEAEVVSRFLAAVGHLPVVEEIILAPEPVGLAEVEDALQETARALTAPGADVASLVERLTALRARREAIQALPTLPESTMVETGRTFAEEWTSREGDLVAQRHLLLSAVDHVRISRSAWKGRHFDSRRVEILWTS